MLSIQSDSDQVSTKISHGWAEDLGMLHTSDSGLDFNPIRANSPSASEWNVKNFSKAPPCIPWYLSCSGSAAFPSYLADEDACDDGQLVQCPQCSSEGSGRDLTHIHGHEAGGEPCTEHMSITPL